MTNLPEFLLYGENTRLFPVVADTSREQRTLSIFLAVLTQVPALARASLGSPGVRIGKRARISTFTEVTFKNDANNDDRPDGLIVVQTGRSTGARRRAPVHLGPRLPGCPDTAQTDESGKPSRQLDDAAPDACAIAAHDDQFQAP